MIEESKFPNIELFDRKDLAYANGSFDGDIVAYCPKNEHLRPVNEGFRNSTNGNGRIYEDIAGEDVPQEVFVYSEHRLSENHVLTIGATGSDFVLNRLFNYTEDEEIPDGFNDLLLVRGSNGSAKYKESPVAMFKLFEKALQDDKIIGITYGDRAIAMEPLPYGKVAHFILFGPITRDIMDLYEDLENQYDVARHSEYYDNVIKRLQGPRFSNEDRDDFHGNPLNSRDCIALRTGIRELAMKNPEVAEMIFKKALKPYRGREVGTFSENRFEFLARANNKSVLEPLDVRTAMRLRTRAVEAAQARNPIRLSVGEDLLYDIGETKGSATARNMEPYFVVGRTTATKIWMDKIAV